MTSSHVNLGDFTHIRTGKLDANASAENGRYPFFTCSREPLRINEYSYDCECVLVAGNGDLNVKYYNGKFDAYQRTYIVESNPKLADQIHVRYIYHFLEKHLETLRKQSIGGVIKYIKLGNLTGAQIPIPHKNGKPDLVEQKRIAAILDKGDAIRRKRKQALLLTDNFLRSVFLDMFGDPVTNPKNLPKRRLAKFGDIVTGNTPSRKVSANYGDYLEWIKSDNINTPSHYLTLANESLSRIGAAQARTAPSGSILVTCIAGSPDCIGNAAMTDRTVSFNQQINAIIPNREVDSTFLYAQILVAKKLIQAASTNSMKGMVSKSAFSAIELLHPNPKQQADFGRVFRAYEAALGKGTEAVTAANSLFASLQQRAFRGEL